jgi:predicted ester cyclase
MKAIHTGIYLLLANLLTTGILHAQEIKNTNEGSKNKEGDMSAGNRNKAVVRNLYEHSLNKRNMELLQDLVSDNYVGIRGEKGVGAFKEPVAVLIKALPDVQWNIQEIISEGNKVFVRWKLRGTHTGQFQHIAATHKIVSNDGMAVFELQNSKIISGQVYTDRLGFLQQLEVVPLDLTLLSYKKKPDDGISFIDKFLVPEKARAEFMARVNINRDFIKTLPGFIRDAAYERTDENGDLIFITVAEWQNEDALKNAKEAVQAEYKRQGFNIREMFERLKITMDRGVYKETMP